MTSSVNLINKKEQRFQSLALVTVVIIYLLIIAGGIVRSTGSGMGCPDWPKCFGRWIPPTEISQLPVNYAAIYGAKLKGEVEFNAVKTWIEYVNRLLGVLSGFFVFGTLLASISYLRKDKPIFWGSLAAFLLIGANGYLGSKVVSTELAQYMITIHMLLAIVVVFALLFVLVRANSSHWQIEIGQSKKGSSVRLLLLVAIVVTLGQIVLGTEVRAGLDQVSRALGEDQRNSWVSQLDWHFYVHRSYSLLVLFLHGYILFQLRKLSVHKLIRQETVALFCIVLLEIGAGVVLAYFSVPPVMQPIHLLLAILLIGLQFVIWLSLTPSVSSPEKEQRLLNSIDA